MPCKQVVASSTLASGFLVRYLNIQNQVSNLKVKKDVIYVDGSRSRSVGKIAVTDSSGNKLFTKLFSYPCCIGRIELEAIKYGHKFLKRGGTIYCDNNGAIKEFKKIHPRIKVAHVRGKENPADRPSKMTISEKEKRADYPTIESCRTLNLRWHKKPKKLKKKTNGREYFDGGHHYHLIRTVDGEAWMTSSKFKRYQKWLRKKNRDRLITKKYNH